VVIGATQAGLLLAQKAIAQGQRVALVQQNSHPFQDIQMQALQKILLYAVEQPAATIAQVVWLIHQTIAPEDFYEPLAKLAEMGVDVVPESGYFRWQPQTFLRTATRQLRGRHYAIATGTVWQEKQDPADILPTDLLNGETWEKLAAKVVLIGTDPLMLTLTYALQRLGKQVQWVVGSAFLGTEDADLAHHLQTFLETTGIEIYKGLAAADLVDILQQPEISIIRGDRRRGATSQLNLPPDCCQGEQMWLRVNDHLQTSHRQIYGCGSVLGGYDLPGLAIAETSVLVKNLTTRKKQPCLYQNIAYRLFEPYPFDHVGYQNRSTPPGTKSIEHTFSMDRVDQLQFPFDVTVKLWLGANDQLLGATVLGDRQGKLISHCRHLVQQQRPFTTWDNLLEASGLAAEICW
jgi:pyruvate/2-oxoglutarate dehydrogenase complex dihydrolipoamide dehydrogenase (E3) component